MWIHIASRTTSTFIQNSFNLIHSAFQKCFRVYSLSLNDMVDIGIVKWFHKAKIRSLLEENLKEIGPLKFHILLKVYFQKVKIIELITAEIPSTMKLLLPESD